LVVLGRLIQRPDFLGDEFKIACADGQHGEDSLFWGSETSKVERLVSQASQNGLVCPA